VAVSRPDLPPGLTAAEFGAVRATPLFARLSEPAVGALVQAATVHTYPPDALVFSVGDGADGFFIVLSGSIQLFVLTAEGAETVIEIVGAGASFAEAAMFASARFPVNCATLVETRLLKLHRGDFLGRLERDPRLALQIVVSLERWQHRLTAELWHLKARTPAQRLAWLLVTLSDAESGSAALTLPHAKGTIAARIGIAPETLSRAFARLAELGVATRGSRVTIADVARLRDYCGL
jgi:CRP/FNR family transcriptional regulator, dissimilatory nitrate respiration regulator